MVMMLLGHRPFCLAPVMWCPFLKGLVRLELHRLGDREFIRLLPPVNHVFHPCSSSIPTQLYRLSIPAIAGRNINSASKITLIKSKIVQCRSGEYGGATLSAQGPGRTRTTRSGIGEAHDPELGKANFARTWSLSGWSQHAELFENRSS